MPVAEREIAQEYMMSWERKRWEKGLEEGRVTGTCEALRRAVLRLAEHRFAHVPEDDRETLVRLYFKEVEAVHEARLDAPDYTTWQAALRSQTCS